MVQTFTAHGQKLKEGLQVEVGILNLFLMSLRALVVQIKE